MDLLKIMRRFLEAPSSLKEPFTYKKSGLLSPNGDFYPLDSDQKHVELAQELFFAGDLDPYLDTASYNQFRNHPFGLVDYLVKKKGWGRTVGTQDSRLSNKHEFGIEVGTWTEFFKEIVQKTARAFEGTLVIDAGGKYYYGPIRDFIRKGFSSSLKAIPVGSSLWEANQLNKSRG